MRQPPSMSVFEYMGVSETIDSDSSYDDCLRIKRVYVSILKDDIYEWLLIQGFDCEKYFSQLYSVIYENAQDILCTSNTFDQYKADLQEILIRALKGDSVVWVEGNDWVN